MKKLAILMAATLIVIPTPSSASLNGKEDYSESRIMAVSLTAKIGAGPWANGSGYLYSPRIVFTAGHLKESAEFKDLYVSPLNSKLKSGMQTIKVIKKFFPSTYSYKNARDDFAILILEKPLADIEPAPLVTPELLNQAIASKNLMTITGYGVYQDKCLAIKKAAPPCNDGTDKTSLVPRTSTMTPWSAVEIKEKFNSYSDDLADHLFLTAPSKGGPCGGDSGGSTTVEIDGTNYYVGTVPSGFWNAYACGQSGGSPDRDTLGYTAPVYKFLNLIATAERYVASHPYKAKKSKVIHRN